MTETLLLTAGSLGLFLLGMALLTDGLKEFAGPSLRRLLVSFTATPARGAVAGTVATAAIQSSSATTLMTVGFVSAGLMTFPQGLGIILGANVGTTMTGWMVAVLGFKLDLGLMAMPLLPLGVGLRLFAGGRLRQVGWIVAGFSLLFIGIDAMQTAFERFGGSLTPDVFPGDSLSGRLQLVLVGAVVTIVTQSSSAGIATALVALHGGAITLVQGAAMVIGMNIGTTFTAMLATLGGSVAARRTGLAHVIYNVLVGILAFICLGPYVVLAALWLPAEGNASNAEITLVAFHTAFNVAGLLLVLPLARRFAQLIERLVPEHGPQLVARLDDGLLKDAPAALDAAAATADDLARTLMARLAARLAGQRPPVYARHLEPAIETLRLYIERVSTGMSDEDSFRRHQAILHAIDHIQRIARRLEDEDRLTVLQDDPRLARLARVLRDCCRLRLETPLSPASEIRFDKLRRILRTERDGYRSRTVAAAASGRIDSATTLRRLDAIRWLHRVTYHLWRIVHHLDRAIETHPNPDPISEAEAGNDLDPDDATAGPAGSGLGTAAPPGCPIGKAS